MSTLYSPETQARLAILRSKLADGTITILELKEGINLMRGDRKNAAEAANRPKARTKAPKAIVAHADDLLDELGGGNK